MQSHHALPRESLPRRSPSGCPKEPRLSTARELKAAWHEFTLLHPSEQADANGEAGHDRRPACLPKRSESSRPIVSTDQLSRHLAHVSDGGILPGFRAFRSPYFGTRLVATVRP